MLTGSCSTRLAKVLVIPLFFLIVSSVVYAVEQNTTATIIATQSYTPQTPTTIVPTLLSTSGPDPLFQTSDTSITYADTYTPQIPTLVTPTLSDIQGPDRLFNESKVTQWQIQPAVDYEIKNVVYNYSSSEQKLYLDFDVIINQNYTCGSIKYGVYVIGKNGGFYVLANDKSLGGTHVSDVYNLQEEPDSIYIYVAGCGFGGYPPYFKFVTSNIVLNANLVEGEVQNYTGVILLTTDNAYAIGEVYIHGDTKIYAVAIHPGVIRVNVSPS